MLTEERDWLDYCMIKLLYIPSYLLYLFQIFHYLALLRDVHFKNDATSSIFFTPVKDANYQSNRMSNFRAFLTNF